MKMNLVPLFKHLLNQLGRDEREATSATISANGAIQLLERAKTACQEHIPIEIPDVDESEAFEHADHRILGQAQPQKPHGSGSNVSQKIEYDEREDLSWGDLAQELRSANSLADGLLTGTLTASTKDSHETKY